MAFVFYDTETTGIHTAFDQILQFGAIRTDENLNEIDRFEIRCRLQPHIVASPGALRVTGISISQLTNPALPTHYQMMVAIRKKLQSWSPSIFLGYNTLQFDERLLRQAFYQTLHPLYLTNTNGNGRTDVLRMVQAASLYAPEALTVPCNEKGIPVFKLDRLAPANGFDHANAHDAMADVEATIHMCRLLQQRTPEIWQNFVKFARKSAVTKFVHSQQIYSLSEFYFNRPSSWLVSTLGVDHDRQSDVLVFDLAYNPDDFTSMTGQQLAESFTKQCKPLRSIRLNAAPILMPAESAPDSVKAKALGMDELVRRARVLKESEKLRISLFDAYNLSKDDEEQEVSPHIEEQIYNGFISDEDSYVCELFHKAPWEERLNILHQLKDTRLRMLAQRLIYFERPDLLGEARRREYETTIARRLLDASEDIRWLTLPEAIKEVDILMDSTDESKIPLMREYMIQLVEWLQIAMQKVGISTTPAAA